MYSWGTDDRKSYREKSSVEEAKMLCSELNRPECIAQVVLFCLALSLLVSTLWFVITGRHVSARSHVNWKLPAGVSVLVFMCQSCDRRRRSPAFSPGACWDRLEAWNNCTSSERHIETETGEEGSDKQTEWRHFMFPNKYFSYALWETLSGITAPPHRGCSATNHLHPERFHFLVQPVTYNFILSYIPVCGALFPKTSYSIVWGYCNLSYEHTQLN